MRILGEWCGTQQPPKVTMIKQIPMDAIYRVPVRIAVLMHETNFIKVQYVCDVCKGEIDNENVCRNGCFIKNPQLRLTLLCGIADGTSKSLLSLKDELAVKAFGLSQN